jgi:sodium transport system ATP-binding protein
MISIENVTKTFPEGGNSLTTALKGITIHFEKGVSCALLGENGAGKTTLLRLLMGFLRPTTGDVRVLGLDPIVNLAHIRKNIAYLPAQGRLYDRLTVREILTYFGRLYGLNDLELAGKVDELSERLEMSIILDRIYGALSSGMRRRVELARLMLGKPAAILLDEPFNGLDIPTRQKLIEYLTQFRKEGITLLISSHITTGLLELCDWVTVLHSGSILASNPLNDFLQKYETVDIEKAFLASIHDLS